MQRIASGFKSMASRGLANIMPNLFKSPATPPKASSVVRTDSRVPMPTISENVDTTKSVDVKTLDASAYKTDTTPVQGTPNVRQDGAEAFSRSSVQHVPSGSDMPTYKADTTPGRGMTGQGSGSAEPFSRNENASSPKSQLIDDFLAVTAKLDQHRNEDLATTFPELRSMIDGTA